METLCSASCIPLSNKINASNYVIVSTGGLKMIINKIIRFLLTATTILITPLKWITIAPTYFLLNAPILRVIYRLLITLAWLPFGFFITVISVLYKSVPVIGFILAFIGIPIVLIGYALSYLMSPRNDEERVFIEASQSYPSTGTII
jgi:hypothetical protein